MTAPAFISVGAFPSLPGCREAGDVMWSSAIERNSQGDPGVLAKLDSRGQLPLLWVLPVSLWVHRASFPAGAAGRLLEVED